MSYSDPNKIAVVSFVSDAEAKASVEAFLEKRLNWKKSGKESTAIFPIDTKYYAALLRFSVSADGDLSDEKESALKSAQAVILVFNPSQSESWKRLSQWQDAVLEASPSVSICLALGKGNVNTAQRSQFVDWCLDCQTEFIEEHEQRPADADPRELFGISRVMDSLRNNMWPSMITKKPGDEKQTALIENSILKAPNDILNEPLSASLAPVEAPQVSRRSEYEPLDGDLTVKSDPETDAIINAMARKREDPTISSSTSQPLDKKAPAKSVQPGPPPQANMMANMNALFEMLKMGEGAEDEDDEAFSLEKAMREMQSLKSHAQGLPDDQRREFAAKIAMQFAEMLDPAGEDDPLTLKELEEEAAKSRAGKK